MGRQDMLDAGNEGRRVHSWSEFALGAAGFSVGIALLLRGNGVDGLFGGLGYQLWLNVTLKRRMEEQETQ